MTGFFGIEGSDIKMITQEERAKFKIFLRHISKRLINAYISKYGLDELSGNLQPKTEKDIEGSEVEVERSKEQAFEDVIKEFLSKIAMHDMSHSLSYLNTEGSLPNKIFMREDNSVVPEFFRQTNAEAALSDIELIRQELHAGIWQMVGVGKKPISLTLLHDKDIKDLLNFLGHQLRILSKTNKAEADNIIRALKMGSVNLEDYINAYFVLILLLTEAQNEMDADSYAKNKFLPNLNDLYSPDNDEAWQEVGDFKERIRNSNGEIFEKLLIDKDAKVVEMLTYIWQNKDSKRVLVDLFFKTTAKYFENLEERYRVKR